MFRPISVFFSCVVYLCYAEIVYSITLERVCIFLEISLPSQFLSTCFNSPNWYLARVCNCSGINVYSGHILINRKTTKKN